MPKIKIKVNITNEEIADSYETNAIIQNNVIKYIEKDKTKVNFNLKDETLCRENDTLQMNYNFKKKYGTIYIKELERKLELKIQVKSKIKNDTTYSIEYKVDKDNFKYEITKLSKIS